MTLSPDFLHQLKRHFSGDLRLDAGSRALYSTDASMYQIEPLGVAIPKSQDDLQAAMELAAKYRVPVLPRGAGTSLGGQAIGEALILDCSRWLDSIIEINPEEQTAIIEPGLVLADLNHAAAKHGLMFGPDPASAERATMGGVIGNNATGAHSILYGMTADHILQADVILSDGSLAIFSEENLENENWRLENSLISNLQFSALQIREKYSSAIQQNFPKTWRNSAGYRINYLLPFSATRPPHWIGDYPNLKPETLNLAPLLAGSEGTLAILRRAKINLVKKPQHTILAVLAYDSIGDACDDVPRLLTHSPSAIELLPRMILQLARSVPQAARQMGWMVGDPAAILIVEFSGADPTQLKNSARKLGPIFALAESVEEQTRVWNVRKIGLGILDSRPQAIRPAAFIEDCAVPVEHLGDFVRGLESILADQHTTGGIYAHASAGCLHIRPMLDLKAGRATGTLRAIAERTLALTLSLGGTMSSEHGDGLARGEWLRQTYGADVSEAMQSLKRAADPHNLLNPKKLFDAPRMDENLRYGESYQAKAWIPALHFEHELGLAGAIEHCNGQGVCRKASGVMCPSFQATREESLSTRGRANLLRALITQPPSIENLKSEIVNSVFSALDLCLACKGCTAECPSGVDMPRLKYEFMNEYYKSQRRPLHDYLFGYFHVVAKWTSPIAPLANVFMQMDWSRKLIAKVAGLTDKRPLPLFASRRPQFKPNARFDKKIIFLSDVFSHYLEPQLEESAVEVLNALGYEVLVLPIIGAGASFLSKGFISSAQRHAEKVLSEIRRLDPESALSVVACEPPEAYCLKHEYTALLPGRRAELESISQRTWLLDEFLLRVVSKDNGFNLRNVNPETRKIFFHPHCHQQAEASASDGIATGSAATVDLLRALGFDVQLSTAGCCGMAGTFGFDAAHYDLSMQIGEMKLFPQVRAADEQLIVSTGASCRMHMKHALGRDAIHSVELIRQRLVAK